MRPLLRAALIAATAAVPALAAPAQAKVTWLCTPALRADPCRGDQTTTYVASDGRARVARPDVPAAPPVDCFYVYPTVSNQPTPNATQTPDPEVVSIATYQAQRFSTRCRVFAPLYRQVTAVGVSAASQTSDTRPYDVAFQDVDEAWRTYLKLDNGGRGVVLIGHSQGSRMLRALIRRVIDPDPAQRRLLVSAIIPGANVTVARGRRVGGDFRNVPACDVPAQTGCVVAYSTYDAVPPDNARFGRTDTDPVGTALDLPGAAGTEVLCTDPAALAGTGDRLESLVPTAPFAPGIIAVLLLKLYGGPPPTAMTPWLSPADHYTGRCTRSNGAEVLAISPVGAARRLDPSPDATWGTHLVDVNLALGNLLTIVGAQTRAWLQARRPLAVRLRARRAGAGPRRLTAIVTGPPGARVRVTLLRGDRRAAGARTLVLGRPGGTRTAFTVRRGGRYRARVRSLSDRSAKAVTSAAVRVRRAGARAGAARAARP